MATRFGTPRKFFLAHAAAALACMIVPHVAQSQAFGVRLGGKLADYPSKKSAAHLQYDIEVPQPYAEFDFYTVLTDPSGQICTVTGLGKSYENDAAGTKAMAAFTSLKDLLEVKYGTSDMAGNTLPQASGPTFQKDLAAKRRSYEARWAGTGTGAGLPAEIGGISLGISALDDATYVTLRYEWSQWLDCMARREKADTSGL